MRGRQRRRRRRLVKARRTAAADTFVTRQPPPFIPRLRGGARAVGRTVRHEYMYINTQLEGNGIQKKIIDEKKNPIINPSTRLSLLRLVGIGESKIAFFPLRFLFLKNHRPAVCMNEKGNEEHRHITDRDGRNQTHGDDDVIQVHSSGRTPTMKI